MFDCTLTLVSPDGQVQLARYSTKSAAVTSGTKNFDRGQEANETANLISQLAKSYRAASLTLLTRQERFDSVRDSRVA